MKQLIDNLTGRHADPMHPIPRWRRAALSCLAFLLGVQVHINGFPYGASRDRHKRTARNFTPYDFGPPPASGNDRPEPGSGLVTEALPSGR